MQKSAFMCSRCDKTFQNEYNFKIHRKNHIGDELHSCSVCDKKFTRASSVKVHEREVHDGIRPYQHQFVITPFPCI